MLNDLSAIPDLQARHLSVLHERLGIRTPEELLRADRRLIQSAMSRLRPRPTLQEISTWQDQARDLMPTAQLTPEPGWEQVSAFVVSFERNGQDHRVVVEQAEQAPPEPRTVTPGWTLDTASAWMMKQLTTPKGEPATETDTLDGPEEPTSTPDQVTTTIGTTPATRTEPPSLQAARPALRLAAITVGTRDGSERPLTEAHPAALVAPAWIGVEVTGTTAPVHIAVRIQPPGRPGITIAEATTHTGTPKRLDLTALPHGDHQAVLVAWTDNRLATPTVIQLPRLIAPTTTALPPS
jgi:hypothetical protein